MGFEQRITRTLTAEISLPAVGQGALGIECRENDPAVESLIAPLNHPPTLIRVTAERAMNHRLNGGCQVPIGAFAELEGEQIRLRGLVGKPDGSEVFRAEVRGAMDAPEELGKKLADDLLSQGADRVLSELGIL